MCGMDGKCMDFKFHFEEEDFWNHQDQEEWQKKWECGVFRKTTMSSLKIVQKNGRYIELMGINVDSWCNILVFRKRNNKPTRHNTKSDIEFLEVTHLL